MTTLIDYALMAGASYISTRPDQNKFPVPQGWTEITELRKNDPSSGFEATYFTNGTEIVISYAGTYDIDYTGDWLADAGLAIGGGSVQLSQAVDYYLQVKAANPGATITLTGHSLGGGLAALVGVFFGVSVTSFDQAPFANSAQDPSITASLNPFNWLFGVPDIAANLKQYLQNKAFVTGAPEIAARDSMVQQLDSYLAERRDNGGIPNSNLVNNIRVDGEFLSSLPIGFFDIIGTTTKIFDHGPHFSPSTDLHAQSLLTAFLQSEQAVANTAESTHTLSEVTKRLTDLLGLIFDEKLFAHRTDTDKENFLERLVKHEAGIWDAATGTTAILEPDAMVTRFTSDLWKLAQPGGLTLSDGIDVRGTNIDYLHNVSRALTAFAMQMYYEDTDNAKDKNKQLFTDLAKAGAGEGGIQFDMADVSTKFKTAFDQNEKLTLTDAKGYQYFDEYLNGPLATFFTDEERALINASLPYMHDWYVQAGDKAMTATDTQNRGAFMLGGALADNLTGGSGDDLLVGNAGDDTLDGGKGSDTLLGGSGADNLNGGDGTDLLLGGTGDDALDGGAGNDVLKGGAGLDTYTFTGNYGIDLVSDSDGSGTLNANGQTLSGGSKKILENIYKDDDTGATYVKLNGGKTIVVLKEDDSNRIIVNADAANDIQYAIQLEGRAA